MVNISQEFNSQSKYLKSSDIGTKVVRAVIAHVDREKVGNETKLVCYFHKASKGMILNRTNARTIADVLGDETENWTGAEIEILSMKVSYQDKMVDGLRVRIPEQQRKPATPTQGKERFIPNARDDARLREGQAPREDDRTPFDDAVPF